jgi:hypothetical protein
VFEVERDQGVADGVSVDAPTEEGPALRDAIATAARIEADERDALETRERLRTEPLDSVEPDDVVRGHLNRGELVHDLRLSAILRVPGNRALGYGGTLYLTSRRLVHIGHVSVNVQLGDISEIATAEERLLVTLNNADGLAFDIDRPRLFRTEIAAALRELRR